MTSESKRTLEERGCLLKVRVQPGAQKTEIKGLMADGSIRVRLSAAPIGGKANEELVRFIARFFGVPASSVRIVRGATSRQKSVLIEGITKAGAADVVSRSFGPAGRINKGAAEMMRRAPDRTRGERVS